MYKLPLRWIDTMIEWYGSLSEEWQVAAAWLLLPVIAFAVISAAVLAVICLPRGLTNAVLNRF